MQHSLPFHRPPCRTDQLTALDLFTGLGGLAAGFHDAGFSITGADIEGVAQDIYALDGLGEFVKADLSSEMVLRNVCAVIGGPPCRPWSAVNLQRRGTEHHDHGLLDRFFQHVCDIRPELYLMENVVAIKKDEVYTAWVHTLKRAGYSIASRILCYADYGAATARRRLFTVGLRGSAMGADEFFTRLDAHRRPAASVRSAIYWARELSRHEHPDHDWSILGSIANYDERYRTGRYGWKRLSYDAPAPSFGSIAKTYILHPEAGDAGFPSRVLSVREALSIMGFSRDFRFPAGTPRAKRYQMVANAVSPIVARACGQVARELLGAEGDYCAIPAPGAANSNGGCDE